MKGTAIHWKDSSLDSISKEGMHTNTHTHRHGCIHMHTYTYMLVIIIIRGAPIEDFTDIPITDILSRIKADADNR